MTQKDLTFAVCYSNSDLIIIGGIYLQFLHEVRTFPRFIQVHCGSEIRKMATIQTYLRGKVSDLDDSVDSVS